MLAVHTTPTGLTAETAQPLRNRVVEAFKPLRLGCCNDGKALINMRKLQPSPVDETFAKQSNFSGKCDISDTNAEIPQQRESWKMHGVKQRAMLPLSRRSAWNLQGLRQFLQQHGMTCINRDECSKFSHHSHAEITHES